jgi:hypothetical protein
VAKVEFADFNLSLEHPMTDDRMALMEALQKADDGNLPHARSPRRCCRS